MSDRGKLTLWRRSTSDSQVNEIFMVENDMGMYESSSKTAMIIHGDLFFTNGRGNDVPYDQKKEKKIS